MGKRIFVLILCAVGMSSLLASCAGGTGRSVTDMQQSSVEQSQKEADGAQSIAREGSDAAADPNAGENAPKPQEGASGTVKSESVGSGSEGFGTEVTGPGSHEGINVFINQNDFAESEAWYPDTESFLQDFGFAGQDPFYEYYDPDGSLRMSFYYNEQTEEGCGLRYYDGASDMFVTAGTYGFTFQGAATKEWDSRKTGEYMVDPVEYREDVAEKVKDYTENAEYDDDGRISHFDAQGIVTEVGDTTPSDIWRIDFTYHENGQLQKIDYRHTTYLFGTYSSKLKSYFDEQGRLMYEDVYVTHGSMDYYYIYNGNGETPKYCLLLDFMHGTWIPEFTIYISGD